MDLTTGTKTFHLDERTHIMGILNVTPDSFSDGGSYSTVDRAVEQATLLESQGADMIDIGGESTRPSHQPISLSEELERILPVIEAVKQHVHVPLSIDTYKAETARQAIEAGADIINDIWGAKREPDIARVAAKYHVPIILMHNRTNKRYTSLISDMETDLQQSIDIALGAGVSSDKIVLDPGIGFAKTSADNLTVLKHLERFKDLGYPVLLGASRKSFIGKILDVAPNERDNGTGATTCLAITKGVSIVRVHNVKLHAELAQVTDAILGKQGVTSLG